MTEFTDQIRLLLDPAFYLSKYPDLASARIEPLDHYCRFGMNEGRDPNPFFDHSWYRLHNPDVAAASLDPLEHYLIHGAAELRNPHPNFDAPFYAEQHPEAAANPLVFHMAIGRARGFPTEPRFDADAFMPATAPAPVCPAGIVVDVIIPCYRGVAETRRCIASVLADPDRPPGRVIVIDDASPLPALSKYLARLGAEGRVLLLRNTENLGFVASVNRGLGEALRADVVLLNSDTEVPPGWLARLAAHAYAEDAIASVSPWSNNATICSYPSIAGGEPAFDLAAIDAAARAVNAGRRARVPATVGFCMYIRRAALDDVGFLDARAFKRGYGEEVDFCLRASARGWRHMLACDTYVHHDSEVSFGAGATAARAAGEAELARRWPDFGRIVERHVRRGSVEPARFALTAELFRRAGLPVVLFVSHSLGGGVDRHLEKLTEGLRGRANPLLLQPSERGVILTAPSLPDHGPASIPARHTADLVRILASVGVARVHIHHVIGLDDLDLRALIAGLGVPFDVTMHDWFLLCPQVNLLPHLDSEYCGEPGQAACNLCIADRPSHGAREILAWRARHAWLPREADRVLCPTEDAVRRLTRHGLGARAVLAPHEPAPAGPWAVRAVAPARGEPLRVALLGVLADQKGAGSVYALAEATEPTEIEFRLIGYPERPLPQDLARRIKATGAYKDADLPVLLAKAAPHVIWFPAQWPETWSYTLSAAIDSGLPIVASRIGAFAERLRDRPLTWLLDPSASAEEWRAAFAAVRSAPRARKTAKPASRPAAADFYGEDYLPARPTTAAKAPARRRVIVVPECFSTGVPTPCAYIRLLQPLDHLSEEIETIVATAEDAMRLRADIVMTHRLAIPDVESAERLSGHCRRSGMKLLYDLDDDLARIPPRHADAALLRPKADVVRFLLAEADAVWVSTPSLAGLRADARLVPNALDERLWLPNPSAEPMRRAGPVRILFMGTTTHADDFALVRPALERLRARYGERIEFDMVGVMAGEADPWIRRILPDAIDGQSYPGFVNWITREPAWDIGIAPLLDTGFNRGKSGIKTLDYGALGLAVLASDMTAYQGTAARLVANTETAWFVALDHLIRHPSTRREMARAARSALLETGTLAAQKDARVAGWREVTASQEGGGLRLPPCPAPGVLD